ncbi:MAG TPA: type II toxin-antitoxin system HicB family antitoxin [Longimicrobiaceae bacterium]
MMNSIGSPFSSAASGLLSVGIEEGPDGSAVVHSLGFPGCVAAGASPQEALDAYAVELSEWLAFRETLGLPVPSRDEELEITVDEWVASPEPVSEGSSKVCFEADLRPLEDAEINEALHLLGDLRGRLLRAVRAIPRTELDLDAGAPWSLRRIFDELARAQWWTLTRLGASPLAEVPESPIARLDTAMAITVQQFTGFARQARDRVLELDEEVWTPRKVLRRLLWLEWSLGKAALAVLEGTG